MKLRSKILNENSQASKELIIEIFVAVIISSIIEIYAYCFEGGTVWKMIGIVFFLLMLFFVSFRYVYKYDANVNYNRFENLITNSKAFENIEIESKSIKPIKNIVKHLRTENNPELKIIDLAIVKICSDNIDLLYNEKRLGCQLPEISFAISIPILKSIKAGDRIIAVDFLNLGEWQPNGNWGDYVAALEHAAKIVDVQRIFVCDSQKWVNGSYRPSNPSKEDAQYGPYLEDIIKKHKIITTNNEYIRHKSKNGMKGYIITKEEYNKLDKERIIDKIDHGFLVIEKSSGLKLAILDEFSYSSDCVGGTAPNYRTTIDLTGKKIDELINIVFEEVKHTILTKNGT